MKVISSQRYIEDKILCEKINVLEATRPAEVVLQVWAVGIDDLAILFDGHHTLEAARQLNIPVRYEIVDHPEGLNGVDLLDQAWIDSDWYEVETGQPAF